MKLKYTIELYELPEDGIGYKVAMQTDNLISLDVTSVDYLVSQLTEMFSHIGQLIQEVDHEN